MAKELDQRQTAKRQQIALAASKLFLTSGYSATSMDAVTAEAGVSKQTLYAYFPTKVDLLTTIVAEQLAQLSLEPAPNTSWSGLDELRDRMVSFSVAVIDRMMTPEAVALLRLLLGEAFQVAELRQLVREALPAQLLARTERLLIQADAAGLIAVPHPNLSARMFFGPLMSYIILDGVVGNQEELTKPDRVTLEYLVDAFLRSVQR